MSLLGFAIVIATGRLIDTGHAASRLVGVCYLARASLIRKQ